jgi:2-hydroxy-3-keto-5-methylthiopentenyl-1-phosphate phosphatase
MILTEHEQTIINNMRHPSIRMATAGESYKDLSDEELTSLIGKMDDYINEIGKTQRTFGNYDEFYVLEFDSIKTRLVAECQRRKQMRK